MAEAMTLLPTGCFGSELWDPTLRTAQSLIQNLGREAHIPFVAHRLAHPISDPEVAHLAFWLLVGVQLSESEGHSRIDLEAPDWAQSLGIRKELTAKLSAFLDNGSLSTIVATDNRLAPLVREGRWLYSQKLLAAEIQVARQVAHQPASSASPAASPSQAVLESPRVLNDEQRLAVGLALQAPLALITGGPGTGKTSIVVAILRALQRQDPPIPMDRILLAAPTGKAAQRMGESIRDTLASIPNPDTHDLQLLGEARPEPKTLHRALGFFPSSGTFRHGLDNPLPADLVIVDEASMIGLELMEALLVALSPTTRLVLLGDADQLPSVDPGNAFSELVQGKAENSISLKRSYRMDPRDPDGRHILMQANRINNASLNAELSGEDGIRSISGPEPDLEQGGVSLLDPTSAPENTMSRFLDLWLAARIQGGNGPQAWRARVLSPLHHRDDAWDEPDLERAQALLDHFEGFRILCPVNEGKGLLGVDPMNRHFHRRMLEQSEDTLEGQPKFLAGEPVIVLANDYRRGLFNGDQGVILPVVRGEGSPHLEAIFRRGSGIVGFPVASIQQGLDHAYAMTVHKSQGSEFQRLALVLPPAEHPALTKQVLYTALTRAKKGVLILGSLESIQAACGRTVLRRSGLLERLAPA